MTRNKRLLLLAWALGAGIAGPCHSDTLQKIRPITIKVIDAQTREPLRGIVVHRLVLRGTFRTSFLWVFPPIEPLVETSIASRKSGYTDDNGEASFEGVEVSLAEYWFRPRVDRIDSEIILVNLEPSEEAERWYAPEKIDKYEILHRSLPNLERLVHPDKKYKGYWLGSADIREAHGREQERASVSFRPDDFQGETGVYFTAPLLRRADTGSPQ
jgi:hypothetical protein